MAGLKSMSLGQLCRCVGGRRLVCPIQWAQLKRCTIIFTLLLLILPYTGSGLDYTIKEVIEVGEADFVPFLGPLKWSPDGTKLAFFKDGILKISDTLGKVTEVTKLESAPHRYDWVSDDKIAAELRTFPGPGMNTDEKLILVDVPSGSISTIHEFATSPGYRKVPGKTTSSGPYETVEGNKFYLFTTYNSEEGKTKVERRTFLDNNSNRLMNDHLLRWGEDGLYMVKLQGDDSTWLAKKPFAQMGYNQIISRDLRFAMDGGQLFRLKDSTIFVIDTILGVPPPNTNVCGIVWFSFNPVAPEALFTVSCDDGHNYVVHRIAFFDCEKFKLTFLDDLIGISDCVAPSFSQDGRRIAFLAESKLHILLRQLN